MAPKPLSKLEPKLAWTADRLQQLRRVVQNAYLPNASGQRLLSVHTEVVIGADRREKSSTTTLLVEAKADDLRGWSISVDVDEQQPEVEAIFGIKLGRVIPVDENAEVCEFLFDPPLKRGELRGARHRLTFTGGGESTNMGYSLSRPAALLLLTVRFEGELPARIISNSQGELPVGPLVELAVQGPEAGLHAIEWEWPA